MGRIRTMKPEMYLHEGLFDLEQETSLPIRHAWGGLFTQCDREGRFEWRPRRLKAAILPYDDLDFSRVLDALLSRGFIVKYACPRVTNGRIFGVIPTWDTHQFINNRESPSELPDPYSDDCEIIEGDLSVNVTNTCDACPTRAPRVPHGDTESLGSAQGEGERIGNGKGTGKEGNGKGEAPSGDGSPPPDDNPPKKKPKRKSPYPADFNVWYAVYPKKTKPADACRAWKLAVTRVELDPDLPPADATEAKAYLLEAVTAFAASGWGQQRQKCPTPANWLTAGQYTDDRKNWELWENDNGKPNKTDGNIDVAKRWVERKAAEGRLDG